MFRWANSSILRLSTSDDSRAVSAAGVRKIFDFLPFVADEDSPLLAVHRHKGVGDSAGIVMSHNCSQRRFRRNDNMPTVQALTLSN
jgi:hypothetical protein